MKKFIVLFILLASLNAFAQENSILWKVEKCNAVSYLLGTNHVFGKTFLESNKQIIAALKSADVVLLENIETKDSIVNARQPFTYVNSLTPAEKAILEKVVDKNIDASKLTIRELLLLTQNYWDKFSCLNKKYKQDVLMMDAYIQNYALAQKKQVFGLEPMATTIDFVQNEYLKGVEETKMIASLKYKLDAISKGQIHNNCEMDELYATGKFKFTLDTSLNLPIITTRNNNWISKIYEVLGDNKKAFIAIGAAHLDYKNGIIAMLKQKGYTVTPVVL